MIHHDTGTTPEDFIFAVLPGMLYYESCPATLKEYAVCVLYVGGWELMTASEEVSGGREHL
jgi:hypothetical protein